MAKLSELLTEIEKQKVSAIKLQGACIDIEIDIKEMTDDALLGCVDGLSHVEKTVLSMSKEETEAHRKEIIKHSKIIETPFGDIVLIKHLIFNAP